MDFAQIRLFSYFQIFFGKQKLLDWTFHLTISTYKALRICLKQSTGSLSFCIGKFLLL